MTDLATKINHIANRWWIWAESPLPLGAYNRHEEDSTAVSVSDVAKVNPVGG